MNLTPLRNTGDVSEEEFRLLFEHRLGANFPRALRSLIALGPMYSFSVANVIHMGLQNGNADEVIAAMEGWCEVVQKAPDAITAHVDTKQFFDVLYAQYFLPLMLVRGPTLWTPPSYQAR